MTNYRSLVLLPLRVMAVMAVMAGLMISTAHADEYADITQLVRAGKLADAMSKVDHFLTVKPRDPQMRFLKGVIQRDNGKVSEAIATFVRLTEDYPELPEPYNNLAVLYASQNQYDKARTSLEMAIRTNPSYTTAHDNLGDIYAKLASQAYSKALQLDAASQQAVPPKLTLIRELFNPTAKGQKPTLVATGPAPAVAMPAPNLVKPPPTLPGPMLSKQPSPAAPVAVAPTQAQTPALAPTPAPSSANPQSSGVIASAPSSASTPSAPAAVAAISSGTRDAEAAVRAWASAWAAKDVKAYLAAYGKDFVPPGNHSRATWEEERRLKITSKSKISVKIDSLKVTINGNTATARFRQDYKAGGLAVTSRKTLELAKKGDHWQIVKESVGG
jgi:tetratricopeptide (TPR) repeat protein